MAESAQDDLDGQLQEPQVEEPVQNDEQDGYIEDDGEPDMVNMMPWYLDAWFWWSTIVHRGEEPDEGVPLEYPPDAVADHPKDAPFPFNLDATWYCAALLALILCVHCELDTFWLLRHGYLHYLMRVSFKTWMTVAISIFSTLVFEILGNIFQIFRDHFAEELEEWINLLLVERTGWGPVDADGGAIQDENGHIEFYRDTRHLLEPTREAIIGYSILIYHYSIMCSGSVLYGMGALASRWLLDKVAGFASNELANFISNIPSIFSLPTASEDESSSLATLLWEFGIPASFQIAIAAFLYLCVFLYMAKAETPNILFHQLPDPFCKLMFQLFRATSMHLLAYTAYQIVCICVVGAKVGFSYDMNDDPLGGSLLVAHRNYHLFPGAALLSFITHYIIKSICKLYVRLSWNLWSDYITWMTVKSKGGVLANKLIYRGLMNEDMEIFNIDKRVIARVAMTALFGLKSSWPARMRLSSVEGIN
ncbi:hypothetical protein F5B20DRAFT_587533 [Whalleya microplaca]|nr:hypothetical protein F5B20DRAFT_587533 [Whalleya microplaca]